MDIETYWKLLEYSHLQGAVVVVEVEVLEVVVDLVTLVVTLVLAVETVDAVDDDVVIVATKHDIFYKKFSLKFSYW